MSATFLLAAATRATDAQTVDARDATERTLLSTFDDDDLRDMLIAALGPRGVMLERGVRISVVGALL